jgi:Leucine-rich repeat (LRR) protein
MIHVKYINNSTNKFTNFNEIFDENQLDIIELSCFNNKLTELPKELGNLINLKIFNCSYNNLTELPKELGNLINLKIFNCSYNNLTELPKELGNLINLQEFDCYKRFIVLIII